MGAYNGWERANWFANDGDDTSQEATLTWDRNVPWTARLRQEVEAVRVGVGVIDLCGFSRFTLSGDGAADWLRGQITGALPRIGLLNLIYFATQTGRILTGISCVRHDEDSFTLMSAEVAQWHDFELLSQHLRQGLALSDNIGAMSTMLVSGPKSRELLAQIKDADLSLGWLSHQTAVLAGKTVTLARVSFVGELG